MVIVLISVLDCGYDIITTSYVVLRSQSFS